MPYYYAGRIYDAAEYSDEAMKYYADFLAHASRTFTESAWVANRLAALKAAAPPASGNQ